METEIPETQARLMTIKLAYSDFYDQFGHPPQDEKQLLQVLAVDNPEETLRSPRDGQPFTICYGVDPFASLDWAENLALLAYEQQGKGTRWVLTVPGAIYELDAEAFQQASFPPGHSAP